MGGYKMLYIPNQQPEALEELGPLDEGAATAETHGVGLVNSCVCRGI
jgi:hypothetical protein